MEFRPKKEHRRAKALLCSIKDCPEPVVKMEICGTGLSRPPGSYNWCSQHDPNPESKGYELPDPSGEY